VAAWAEPPYPITNIADTSHYQAGIQDTQVMPSILIKCSKKHRKMVWLSSLFLGWGLAFFPGSNPKTLAYGSFLVWAISAGFVWDRKAPFLTVGIFLAGSASLSWEVLSMDPWRWFSDASGPWAFVVFLSSLSSSLWVRVRSLEQGILHNARWSVWGRMNVHVGHEFKNQIAIVTGYLDQMKDDELSAAQLRKIERSLLANERMLKLLAQLRLVTRDCLNEPLQVLTLPAVLQDALELLERPLHYRGVTVNRTFVPGLPNALGHPILLQTLLVHLILHSLERFKGQPASDRKEICIEMTRQGEGIDLHYRDNAQRAKSWDETSQTLARQLLLRQGGCLQQNRVHPQGWDVLLHFKTASQAGADGNHELLSAS
jgi:hypothetical protein